MNSSRKTSRITKYQLSRALHAHLRNCGFTKNGHGYKMEGVVSKEIIRELHMSLREERLEADREFLSTNVPLLRDYFARGCEVDPRKIKPKLIEVIGNSVESRLFRLATKFWSVPVSQGFGRRMRFLVMDEQNNKLIGIFALGDPVFNLRARDQWIGWDVQDRMQRLISVMDAYVVGALPPYSYLIGGKLVAALAASDEVRKAYDKKYLESKSIISDTKKHAKLVLVTTTSALGRSSLYNRLSIPNGPEYIRIGATAGYGHFHLSGDIFEMMRRYLKQTRHPYSSAHQFGQGPNWRFRVARVALAKIGLNANQFMQHGIEREVYAVPLAENWKEILLGKQSRVRAIHIRADEIAEYCLSRWMVPRSERDKRYLDYDPSTVLQELTQVTANK